MQSTVIDWKICERNKVISYCCCVNIYFSWIYFLDIKNKIASVISWTLENSGARFSKPYQQLISIFHRLWCNLCFNLERICASEPYLTLRRCEDTRTLTLCQCRRARQASEQQKTPSFLFFVNKIVNAHNCIVWWTTCNSKKNTSCKTAPPFKIKTTAKCQFKKQWKALKKLYLNNHTMRSYLQTCKR